MSARVDIGRIARRLGAVRRGKVSARGGYFGAMQLAAEVQSRFRVPNRGGRATDPEWNTKRLLPLAETTLRQLEQLSETIQTSLHVHVEPMQVAALVLENSLQKITKEEATNLVESHRLSG